MRKRKILGTVMSLFLVFAILLTGCGNGESGSKAPEVDKETSSTDDGATEDPIRIAFLYSLSGGNAESGQMCLDAVNLAIKHINEAGGIKSMSGAKLEVEVFDATSDPAQAKNVAERALNDKTIIAAVGAGTSAITLPMLPVFEKERTPIVTFTNAADLTNQGYQYIFSTTNRGTALGAYQAEFIKYLNEEKSAGIEDVAIIYENSANGISMADGARIKANEMGLNIVFDESYPAGHVDFAPMITAIKNSGAHAVMPYGYMQEAKLIFSAMRDLDYFPIIMGNSNWPSYYEALGDATNGVIAVGNWNYYTKQVQDNPEYKKIVDEFEETYGYFMTEQSGPAYDGIKIIAKALEINPTRDSQILRDTISSNEFEGMQLVGNYKFNSAGENVNGVPAVTQWQHGTPVCVYPQEHAVKEYIDPGDF